MFYDTVLWAIMAKIMADESPHQEKQSLKLRSHFNLYPMKKYIPIEATLYYVSSP